MRKQYLTSESVTRGHPDKICDQVSDAILDAALEQYPDSRVAIETLIKENHLIIAGEVTTNASLDFKKIGRDVVEEIGYKVSDIQVYISKQSPDISRGVTKEENFNKKQGAGDQGMMYGYAINETSELMPLPITLAHELTSKLIDVKMKGQIPYLKPDGKSQVSIMYENGVPVRASNIIVSSQHEIGIDWATLEFDVLRFVINPICKNYIDKDTSFHVNPTGSFVVGGPDADTGVTGRKIIVDTYGGAARHGGGAFSGKDPSKVDRSGAYAARYIAKNIVATGLADKCEVQIAYSIGIAEPVSLNIDCFGTEKINLDGKLEDAVRQIFPLEPERIISELNLKRPIYRETAFGGHFGRNGFPWEKVDKADELRRLIR